MLTFKMSDLKPIIEHAQASKEFSKGYEQEARPSLFLVHDAGVYLMSAGKPGLLRPDRLGKETGHVVAYAFGCNPDKDVDECYHRSNLEVGGDDFAEVIELDFFLKALQSGKKFICIDFKATSYELKYCDLRGVAAYDKLEMKEAGWL